MECPENSTIPDIVGIGNFEAKEYRMELRDYQKKALDVINERVFAKKRTVLIQAPTGSGKTIIFSSFIATFKGKILVLAHRTELIKQAKEKLIQVAPELEDDISIFCSTLGEKQIKRITIASKQSIFRHEGEEKFDVMIIDEVHNVNANSKEYPALIQRYGCTMVGFTATPYRLKHGYIYGDQCINPGLNLFDDLDYKIPMRQLIDEGHLVDYRGKMSIGDDDALKKELKGVNVDSAGDFKQNELADLMAKEHHLMSAVKTINDFAQDRKSIVLFAVTIEHGESLVNVLNDNGISATIVHSKLKRKTQNEALTAFNDGSVRVIVNIGVLTEGWDEPRADCVLLCRPTMSAALWVQMVGRALRLYEGKKDALIIDMGGNYARHGSPEDPKVKWGKKKKKNEEEENCLVCSNCCEIFDRPDEKLNIVCPSCKMRMHYCVRCTDWVIYVDGSDKCAGCSAKLINCLNCNETFNHRDTSLVQYCEKCKLQMVLCQSCGLVYKYEKGNSNCPGCGIEEKEPEEKEVKYNNRNQKIIDFGTEKVEIVESLSAKWHISKSGNKCVRVAFHIFGRKWPVWMYYIDGNERTEKKYGRIVRKNSKYKVDTLTSERFINAINRGYCKPDTVKIKKDGKFEKVIGW